MTITAFKPKRSPESQPANVHATGLIRRAKNAFWLAPMAGITDVVFRELMDEMGAGVLISELVSAKGLLYNSDKTKKMIRTHLNSSSLMGIQLFGESADDIIDGAKIVAGSGADFIDINLGCPVKKVVKKGCGAALLRDPGHLESFLTKIRRNIEIPLTVKMRTGWSDEELTIHECTRAAYNAGCEWVAIHGRTRAQGYEGKADWDIIREVKENAKIPVVGNGDIRSADLALRRLRESGVDAVMIGRGALRNPWIFRECLGGSEGNASERAGLIARYLERLRSFYDTRITLIMLRKFAGWMAFGYPGAAKFRRKMYELTTPPGILECAYEFFHKAAYFPAPRFEESEAFMMGGHG